ncbi:MAG TPA: cupin domain-containing protein [Gemmatimonadales bacterium]|nr:cupin domain-containing protein [Gemmatimonadales bacterium]
MITTRQTTFMFLYAAAALAWPRDSVAQDSSHSPARVAYTHALPSLDGRRLEATVVEVTYGPGQSSAPHRHPCPVIGYVIEGEYRTQSGKDSAAVYHAGQSFYEAPGAVHRISANASATQPVRFLAYFVCDRQGPLSVPEKRP